MAQYPGSPVDPAALHGTVARQSVSSLSLSPFRAFLPTFYATCHLARRQCLAQRKHSLRHFHWLYLYGHLQSLRLPLPPVPLLAQLLRRAVVRLRVRVCLWERRVYGDGDDGVCSQAPSVQQTPRPTHKPAIFIHSTRLPYLSASLMDSRRPGHRLLEWRFDDQRSTTGDQAV